MQTLLNFLKDFNPFSPEMIVHFISIISLLTAHFMLTDLVNLNFMIQALELKWEKFNCIP